MKADPADIGPEATPESASVLSDRRAQEQPAFGPLRQRQAVDGTLPGDGKEQRPLL
jgi:hypothetical protein